MIPISDSRTLISTNSGDCLNVSTEASVTKGQLSQYVTLYSAWKTALYTGSMEAPPVSAATMICCNHFFLASPRIRSAYVRYKYSTNTILNICRQWEWTILKLDKGFTDYSTVLSNITLTVTFIMLRLIDKIGFLLQ